MAVEQNAYEFRLKRKTVKDILTKKPEGISKEELARLAEGEGVGPEEFDNLLANLMNGGHVYLDKLGKLRIVRNE